MAAGAHLVPIQKASEKKRSSSKMPPQPSATLLDLPAPTKMVINGAVEEEHTEDDESDKEQPNAP